MVCTDKSSFIVSGPTNPRLLKMVGIPSQQLFVRVHDLKLKFYKLKVLLELEFKLVTCSQ